MFKINSTIKPIKFESLNNGIWYYNFDIKEELTEDIEGKITKYNYYLIRISGEPTINKCYNAIVKAYGDEINEDLKSSILEMVEIDFGVRKLLTDIELEKRKVIKEITNYDISPEVNSFFLNDMLVWLDKSTRVGLMNSLNIEKASGKEISTLWFGNIKLNVNTELAIQMLSALELYALECYNRTAEHKMNVENLTTIEDIYNYDYTTGYPDKLKFTI